MYEIIRLENEKVITPVALTLDNNLVVFFHDPTSGTIIQSDGHFPVGHYSPHWIMALDWKPFKGTVTINFK